MTHVIARAILSISRMAQSSSIDMFVLLTQQLQIIGFDYVSNLSFHTELRTCACCRGLP
jgi:hypothetical protein